MKNKILSIMFIFLVSVLILNVNVMAVNINLKEKWSDGEVNIEDFQKTYDNGYIIVGDIEKGERPNGLTATDAIILKVDSEGNEEWRKTFEGSDSEYFYDVIEDSEKNFVVTGITYSSDIDGLENKGDADGVIVKYNQNGELLWKNIYGKNSYDYFSDIKISKNNEIYVVGKIEEDNDDGGILLKYNLKDGVLESERCYDMPDDNEKFRKMILLEDGSCIIIGEGDSEDKYNKGIVLKYDKDMKLEWYRGMYLDWLTNFQDIIVTSTGEGIIVGSTYSSSSDSKILIYKFNIDTGAYIEKIKFDYDGVLLNIIETEDGYIAVGEKGGGGVPMSLRDLEDNDDFIYGPIIVKFDKEWNVKWKKIDEDFDQFSNIKKAFDGKIYLEGSKYDFSNYPDYSLKNIIFELNEEYFILVSELENGKIEVKEQAELDTIVELKIIPEEGYTLKNIEVRDVDGNLVEIDKENFTFKMPGNDVIINAEFEKKNNLKGDVNGDGDITLADYALVLSHVKKTKLLKGDALKAADVNEDGNVTLADYTLILSHVKKTQLLK